MYDKAKEYIKISYLNGIAKSLKEDPYYSLMPPRLKNKLIFEVLEDYYEKFYYFFKDIQYQVSADDVFVRKILSKLDCQM